MVLCANGILVGAEGSALVFSDVTTGAVTQRIAHAHSGHITALAASLRPISSEKQTGLVHAVVSGGQDGYVKAWSVPTASGTSPR